MLTNEKEILNAIIGGDSGAFAEIVNKLKDSAFALCQKIIKDENEAEDVLQEAFMKLYNAIVKNKFEERAKLSTYFYSIVYNTSIEHYRKKSTRPFNIYSIDVTESNYQEGDELIRNLHQIEFENVTSAKSNLKTENVVKESEIQKIVNDYMSALPEQYSVILTMFYLNQLKIEEISGILKLPAGTVKNRIHRAKEKLKTILLNVFTKEEILEYI